MFDAEFHENGEIALRGMLDAAHTEQADRLLGQITSSRTLNLKDLDYISSAGLGLLLLHQKRLARAGCRLRLVHPNKHVQKIFLHAGFYRIFEIGEPADDASHPPL